MAYILKIKRKDPIDMDEWNLILKSFENIRLCKDQFHTMSGPNGMMLRSPVYEGDAEIYLAESQKWIPVFHYREEESCVSFRAPHKDRVEERICTAAPEFQRAKTAIL